MQSSVVVVRLDAFYQICMDVGVCHQGFVANKCIGGGGVVCLDQVTAAAVDVGKVWLDISCAFESSSQTLLLLPRQKKVQTCE